MPSFAGGIIEQAQMSDLEQESARIERDRAARAALRAQAGVKGVSIGELVSQLSQPEDDDPSPDDLKIPKGEDDEKPKSVRGSFPPPPSR